MKYSLITNNKVCFEAPFLNICLVTISVNNSPKMEFQNLILDFILSSFECPTLYKFENRVFQIQNGKNKGIYEQKTFGPYQAKEIMQSDITKTDDTTIVSKFISIQPQLKELNPNVINCYKRDLRKAERLMEEFSKAKSKFSLQSHKPKEVVINGFDMNIYSCYFGKIDEKMFKILTFEDE